MGFLDGLFKQSNEAVIGAAMKGTCIELSEVPDEAFSQGILGKGIAIQPVDGKVFAPADAEVSIVFPTGHAVVLKTKEGAEILIHVGLDTVSLKGVPFVVHAKADTKVKKGDLILEADLEAIKASNLEIVTPIVICNPDEFAKIDCITGNEVVPGDEVIKLSK